MMPGPSRWSRKASPRSMKRSWDSMRKAEAGRWHRPGIGTPESGDWAPGKSDGGLCRNEQISAAAKLRN
jgi:hypothetical protein